MCYLAGPCGYKLNAAEIELTSMGGISHAGTGRIERKIFSQFQQSSDQCWNISQVDSSESRDCENLTANVQSYYYTMPAIIISISPLMETWADF